MSSVQFFLEKLYSMKYNIMETNLLNSSSALVSVVMMLKWTACIQEVSLFYEWGMPDSFVSTLESTVQFVSHYLQYQFWKFSKESRTGKA